MSATLDPEEWDCKHATSLEPVDASCLGEVITPHGRGSRAQRSRKRSLLESLAELENGEALKVKLDFPFWDAWIQRYSLSCRGNESDAHLQGKVYAAAYLDACGHEISRSAVHPDFSNDHRWVLPSVLDAGWDRHWVYDGSNFERGLGYGKADAACNCDSHTVAVEYGKMDPEKYLLARIEGLVDYLIVAGAEDVLHPNGRRRYVYYVFDVGEGLDFRDEEFSAGDLRRDRMRERLSEAFEKESENAEE